MITLGFILNILFWISVAPFIMFSAFLGVIYVYVGIMAFYDFLRGK